MGGDNRLSPKASTAYHRTYELATELPSQRPGPWGTEGTEDGRSWSGCFGDWTKATAKTQD